VGMMFITYSIIHESLVREGWTRRPSCLALLDLLDLDVRLAVKGTFDIADVTLEGTPIFKTMSSRLARRPPE